MIKTKEDIIKDLITSTVAQTDKITYFGKDSVVRALFSSFANTMYEVWSDLFQIKRQAQLQTAAGTDLDEIARRHGITRRGATYSTVPVIIEGTAGFTIPAGTQIFCAAKSIYYQTLHDLTLGKNAALARPLNNNVLADVVLCESLTSGSSSQVSIYDLNEISIGSLESITAVKNLVPSAGGEDQETDEELRLRIYESNDLLAQGTIAFYEALAKAANENILRSKAKFNVRNYGIEIYLLKDSLGLFDNAELTTISEFMYANQRALTPITCKNAELLGMDIEITIRVKNGYTFDEVFKNIAITLTDYFNTQQKEFGSLIRFYDVENLIARTEGVQNLQNVFINGDTKDIQLGETQLPRLQNIILHDNYNDSPLAVDLTYLVI